MYEVSIRQEFSAAHNLREIGGKCESLHGHNFKVEVAVESATLDDQGLVIDFRLLKDSLASVLNQLDHKFLNDDVEDFRDGGLNPSAENIARWIYERLSEALKTRLLPTGRDVSVSTVRVWESESSSAAYVAD